MVSESFEMFRANKTQHTSVQNNKDSNTAVTFFC